VGITAARMKSLLLGRDGGGDTQTYLSQRSLGKKGKKKNSRTVISWGDGEAATSMEFERGEVGRISRKGFEGGWRN